MPTQKTEDQIDYLLLQHFGACKKRGNQRAFDTLHARHDAYLLSQLACYDTDMAERARQWAFKRLGLKWAKIDEGTSIQGWLVLTAKRYAINNSKKVRAAKRGGGRHHRDATAFGIRDERAEDPADAAATRDLGFIVLQKVNELPTHQRDVIECVYVQKLTLTQTAAELGINSGTVRSRLNRALQKLREKLGAASA